MPDEIVTETFRLALSRAITIAQSYHSPEITPEIIFAAIISDSRARTATILRTFGITAENYQPARRQKRQTVSPSFSNPARHTLNAAIQLARKQGFEKATTQHYITAIFTRPPDGFIDSIKSDCVSPNQVLAAFQQHREEP